MKFIVPKVKVSGIDFLTEQRQRTPNPYFGDGDGEYDNVLLDEILDWLREVGYVLIDIEESWFYMNDVAMSVEICLDHDEKMAQKRLLDSSITMVSSGGFGEYRNLSKPDGAQLSLVSSAGMAITKDSLVLDAGGTIFLQDGLNAQQSQVRACELIKVGGKDEARWFCCERAYSAHQVYASFGEAEAALRGLFSIVNGTVPEIHLFKPLDIISVGGGDDAISESQTNVGDVNATAASDETNTATTTSVKSESSSAGTSTIKHQVVTFALIVASLL